LAPALQYSSLAIIRVAYQAGLPSFFQSTNHSGEPDSWIASVHAFQPSCNLVFLHSCNQADRIACVPECVPSALPEVRAACLPAIIQRQRTNQFHSIVCLWHCLAVRGTVWHCGTVQRYREQALLCIVIFINGFMQKSFDKSRVTRAASRRFSLLHLIRPAGRIFVFTGTRQVVF